MANVCLRGGGGGGLFCSWGAGFNRRKHGRTVAIFSTWGVLKGVFTPPP